MNRPSPKELFNKIRAARQALAENRVALLNQSVMACDAIELDYVIDTDLLTFLPDFLNDITPARYIGLYPPQRSYETEINGMELFAFELESEKFGCKLYIKFAYSDEMLWLVSFHQSRSEGK